METGKYNFDLKDQNCLKRLSIYIWTIIYWTHISIQMWINKNFWETYLELKKLHFFPRTFKDVMKAVVGFEYELCSRNCMWMVSIICLFASRYLLIFLVCSCILICSLPRKNRSGEWLNTCLSCCFWGRSWMKQALLPQGLIFPLWQPGVDTAIVSSTLYNLFSDGEPHLSIRSLAFSLFLFYMLICYLLLCFFCNKKMKEKLWDNYLEFIFFHASVNCIIVMNIQTTTESRNEYI